MVIGIICEYNPFHKGHKYQIDKIKDMYPDSTVVAIMSGNVTQRGEFALLDKYTRAEAAVICGVDCVFEIPYPYCASNAEVFARAGVYIASSVGITHLCFGTESGSVEYVTDIANTVESAEFEDKIKEILEDKSISYSLAREQALLTLGKVPPKKSNDILGVEYIRAIKKYAKTIQPLTIKREGADYNDLTIANVMSASAIREYFLNNNALVSVPQELDKLYFNALNNGEYMGIYDMENFLFRSVVMSDPDILSKCYDIPSGAEYFISDVAKKSKSSKEFFENLTTKTYTYSRLRRIIIYSVLGTKNVDEVPAYTSLLSANKRGRNLLKALRNNACLPIITKLADYKSLNDKAVKQFEHSARADKLYMTFIKDKAPCDYMKKSPVIKD